jgi:hypothetical protein
LCPRDTNPVQPHAETVEEIIVESYEKVKKAFGIVIDKYKFGLDGPAPHYLSCKQTKGHANKCVPSSPSYWDNSVNVKGRNLIDS